MTKIRAVLRWGGSSSVLAAAGLVATFALSLLEYMSDFYGGDSYRWPLLLGVLGWGAASCSRAWELDRGVAGLVFLLCLPLVVSQTGAAMEACLPGWTSLLAPGLCAANCLLVLPVLVSRGGWRAVLGVVSVPVWGVSVWFAIDKLAFLGGQLCVGGNVFDPVHGLLSIGTWGVPVTAAALLASDGTPKEVSER